MIGVCLWEWKDSWEAWRASQADARRREAKAPYVVQEARVRLLVRRGGWLARVDRSGYGVGGHPRRLDLPRLW